MKKTLITLAALAASVASAVTIEDAALDIANPNGTLSAGTGFSGTGGDYTMTLVINWEKALEGLGIWSDPSVVKVGHSNDYWWNNGFSLFKGADENAGKLFATIRVDNGDQALTGDGLSIVNTTYAQITSDYVVDGLLALTYTYSSATDTITLSVVDTENSEIATLDSAYVTKDWSVNNAYNYMTMDAPDGIINHIYVFDSALSSADIINISKDAIPEPATATLSLLALAGLAVRRRRK